MTITRLGNEKFSNSRRTCRVNWPARTTLSIETEAREDAYMRIGSERAGARQRVERWREHSMAIILLGSH
jgi:hypothetical protein